MNGRLNDTISLRLAAQDARNNGNKDILVQGVYRPDTGLISKNDVQGGLPLPKWLDPMKAMYREPEEPGKEQRSRDKGGPHIHKG